ncbi:unnamed protein product, partial [Choristocarpus tenellus]
MFLAGMTRPDLSNSVQELGRYAASPCDRHWKGLQHVLRYLAGTTKIGIHYPAGGGMDNGGLVGYGDSDWGNDTASRRSVTGYLILINGAPIAWKSKIQGAVTTSSSEAEWTVMVHGMRHAIFRRGKLKCTREYVSKGFFTVKYIPTTL